MSAETKDMPGTLAGLDGVVTAARDALTEDMIGRMAGSTSDAMDLLDRVNRSGLSKAIPQLAQMVENGDLQRLVNLARVYGSAEDALTEDMISRISDAASGGLSLLDQIQRSGLEKALPTLTRLVADGDIERLAQLARVYGAAQDALSDEMIGRLTEAVGEGLSLLDRLNRGGAGRLVEMLAKLEASGSLERIAALLPTFVDRIEMVGGLLESMETAAKQAEAERTDGGIVAMYRMLTDARTQETLRFMLALGQNMHERYARKS